MADESGAAENVDQKDEGAPLVKDPFDRLGDVWKSEDRAAQRKAVSEIFCLEDGPGVCIETMKLDFSFLTLLFARENKFDLTQTRAFYNIVISVRDTIADSKSNFESARSRLRELLLDPYKAQIEQSSGGEAKAKANSADISDADGAGGAEGESKEEGGEADGGAEDGKDGEAATEPEKPAAKEEPTKPVFAAYQVRLIIDFVKSTLLSHYFLHRAVFNEDFEPQRKQVTFRISGDAGEGQDDAKYSLEKGEEKDQEAGPQDEKEAGGAIVPEDSSVVAKSDAVADLIKQHLGKAAQQMNAMLAKNAAQLNEKMAQFEAQLKASK